MFKLKLFNTRAHRQVQCWSVRYLLTTPRHPNRVPSPVSAGRLNDPQEDLVVELPDCTFVTLEMLLSIMMHFNWTQCYIVKGSPPLELRRFCQLCRHTPGEALLSHFPNTQSILSVPTSKGWSKESTLDASGCKVCKSLKIRRSLFTLNHRIKKSYFFEVLAYAEFLLVCIFEWLCK